jgi:hypothetical protein
MQKDLEVHEKKAANHPIIAALAGDKTALESLPSIEVPDEESLDAQRLPDFHVLPADPSQEQAILAARLGQSFVLEGPPGTGKTQTIANIIAACIADGKRILFVSEKMAALEAVYRRLKDRKLDKFCLEAHSHKANKTEILSQLRAALDARGEKSASLSTNDERDRLRDDLNAHCAALHQARLPLNITPYQARARIAALGSIPDIGFVISEPASADSDRLFLGERLTEQLALLHRFFPVAETHCWRGLQAESFSPNLREELREVLDDLLHLADAAPSGINDLRVRCGLEPVKEDICRSTDADKALAITDHLFALLDLPSPSRPYLNYAPQALNELHATAGKLQQRQTYLNETEKKLLHEWTPAIFDLPHNESLHRLTDAPRAEMEMAFGIGWADKSDLALEEDSQALSQLEQAAAKLEEGGRRIAELTGLDPVTNLLSAQRIRAILLEATKDPKPQSGWFALGALTQLSARA